MRGLGAAVAAWVLSGAVAAAAPAEEAPLDYSFAAIRAAFAYPGVDTSVTWLPCGEVNAFYSPAEQRVILCAELLTQENVGYIEFVVAHELAHGVIHQRAVTYTGSEEDAADELAAYILIGMGKQRAVMQVASMYLKRGRDETPWDDHAGDRRRGVTLGCLAATSLGYDAPFCPSTAGDWQRANRTWTLLLPTE